MMWKGRPKKKLWPNLTYWWKSHATNIWTTFQPKFEPGNPNVLPLEPTSSVVPMVIE